jgi:hypothetical protein
VNRFRRAARLTLRRRSTRLQSVDLNQSVGPKRRCCRRRQRSHHASLSLSCTHSLSLSVVRWSGPIRRSEALGPAAGGGGGAVPADGDRDAERSSANDSLADRRVADGGVGAVSAPGWLEATPRRRQRSHHASLCFSLPSLPLSLTVSLSLSLSLSLSFHLSLSLYLSPSPFLSLSIYLSPSLSLSPLSLSLSLSLSLFLSLYLPPSISLSLSLSLFRTPTNTNAHPVTRPAALGRYMVTAIDGRRLSGELGLRLP